MRGLGLSSSEAAPQGFCVVYVVPCPVWTELLGGIIYVSVLLPATTPPDRDGYTVRLQCVYHWNRSGKHGK